MVVGGRPGAFKTGFTWDIILRCAELGARCIFLSLEMDLGLLGVLAVSKFSGIPKDRIAEALHVNTSRPFTEEERSNYEEGDRKYKALSSRIRLHGPEHGRSIRSVLKAVQINAFDIVGLDHVGMVGRDENVPETTMLNITIDSLNRLAKGRLPGATGYRPWVIATSPLNRKIEESLTDRPPRLSDFRASGRVEYDADVALGLRKVKLPMEDDESALFGVECYVLKNRFGPHPLMIGYRVNGGTQVLSEATKAEQGSPPPPPQKKQRQQKSPPPPEDEQGEFDIP